ncbi:MAG: hypothetical protein CME70_10400 [Halobacteriovorax sp.]|nr:hypothetical protein [Halobacteriovorax sp.]|tara:strand:- start:135109 stop:135501 length:393 start_codon:yes stop_codon:yes gene_type:complete
MFAYSRVCLFFLIISLLPVEAIAFDGVYQNKSLENQLKRDLVSIELRVDNIEESFNANSISKPPKVEMTFGEVDDLLNILNEKLINLSVSNHNFKEVIIADYIFYLHELEEKVESLEMSYFELMLETNLS